MVIGKADQAARQATQDFVPIREIRDGLVILKNNGLRLVMMVSSINFALKSEEEQISILLQFQNFLNSLDFSLQIYIQSRKLDIRPYLQTLEERFNDQTNDLMKIQIREYVEFIKKFTESTDIMTKNFFVVVPFNTPVVNLRKSGLFGKFLPAKTPATSSLDTFEEYRSQIEQRAAVVEQGLRRIGLRAIQLGTEELVEFYFQIFNPGENAPVVAF